MEDLSRTVVVGLLLLSMLLLLVKVVLLKLRPDADVSLTVVAPDPLDFAVERPGQGLARSVSPAEREVVA